MTRWAEVFPTASTKLCKDENVNRAAACAQRLAA